MSCKIQKVFISGLGAVGGAYAGMLYDMNPGCIKVIADQDRIERYKSEGIFINGKCYDFDYVSPEAYTEPADLIIVAVKQHHLEQSIPAMRNFVGKDTVILSLLNGIVSEEIIGQAFGMEKMLYAYCVGTDTVREGTRIRYTKVGQIVYGEKKNETHSPRVTAVKELFDRAGIPSSIPEDMLRALWWKFMMNVGVNQISAILKAPYGVFKQVEESRELMRMAAREVVRLSEKAGVNLSEKDIEEYIAILLTLSPEGKTSMLQDVEAGRKTEVEIFSGTVIELGRRYGVETPINDLLYRMIRTMEKVSGHP